MAPDPKHLDDPFDTSDELMEEAAAMEARAAQRRQASIDEVHERITPMALQHTADTRAAKVAQHEAALARTDAKEARGRAVAAVDEVDQNLKKADELEAAGDLAAASELREETAGLTEYAQRQTAQAAASEAAATAADERAALLTTQDEARMAEATTHFDRSAAEEAAADQMERSAGVMRNAGTQMTEAERLEAAAIDLRSRGVEGVERVDAAAKTARDEAEVLTLRARQQDPSHTFGTDDDLGIDPDLIEIEPNTPDAPAATDDLGIDPDLIEIEPNTPDAPAATDDVGIDPDLIEIEPNASTDGFQTDGFQTDGFQSDGFEGDGSETTGDFATSDDSGESFDNAGDGGFDADFEA